MRFHVPLISLFSLSAAVFPSPASAAIVQSPITLDTFIDSAGPNNNYGGDAKVKAVSNGGSSMFPLNEDGTGSLTHTLFKLPGGFWDEIDKNGSGPVGFAYVAFYPFNNSLMAPGNASNNPHTNIELHPLTATFGEGNGLQTSPDVTPSTSGGATWLNADTNTPWATAGGDYDAANFALISGNDIRQIKSKGSVPFVWDITALINNLTTRAKLRNFGALLKVNAETTYKINDFASLDSHEYSTDTDHLPYAVIPEPISAGLTTGAFAMILSLGRLRRKIRPI